MCSSWLVATYTLPPPGESYGHLETGNSAPSMNQEHCLNTSWKLSFLDLGIRQALEAQIIWFGVQQR